MGIAPQKTVDVLVVGAGVGGIYSTYRLTKLGFNVQCIDLAEDVGGTWYFNRYPGAMSDTETYLYRYSWDKDDLQTYPWTHHYIYQPEILKYLEHVVAKYDLRKYMQFKTEMTGAVWEEENKRWKVFTTQGVFLARHLVNSLGILSTPNYPNIPGFGDFQGKIVHTSSWDPELKLEGKRVGIIGNGSTGVQVITAIGPVVGSLMSFQRNPQYSVPSGQGPIAAGYRDWVNTNYDQIWENVFSSAVGFNVPEVTRKCFDYTPEERREIFQECWDKGNGFRFMFSAFGDVSTNQEANDEASNFIKSKIDEIVKDPVKAAKLKPREIYARRPLCDTGYYQTFNRPNVDIVADHDNPITRIVPSGLQLADGTVYDLDVIIFATGFDALEGSYLRLNIVGRNGFTIKQHWADGPKAYGGIACAGFPNMWIVSGPQGPFANFPPVIETEINIICSCIEYAEKNIAARSTPGANSNEKERPTIMEVTPEAEQGWSDLCDKLVEGSLFKKTSSWIFGANVNRKQSTKFFFSGLKPYVDWCKDVVANDFKDFKH
jgi:cation diffusion facilitator CzcD-associated flavoprotein CzcO